MLLCPSDSPLISRDRVPPWASGRDVPRLSTAVARYVTTLCKTHFQRRISSVVSSVARLTATSVTILMVIIVVVVVVAVPVVSTAIVEPMLRQSIG